MEPNNRPNLRDTQLVPTACRLYHSRQTPTRTPLQPHSCGRVYVRLVSNLIAQFRIAICTAASWGRSTIRVPRSSSHLRLMSFVWFCGAAAVSRGRYRNDAAQIQLNRANVRHTHSEGERARDLTLKIPYIWYIFKSSIIFLIEYHLKLAQLTHSNAMRI